MAREVYGRVNMQTWHQGPINMDERSPRPIAMGSFGGMSPRSSMQTAGALAKHALAIGPVEGLPSSSPAHNLSAIPMVGQHPPLRPRSSTTPALGWLYRQEEQFESRVNRPGSR